jgi:hypothetical protein
VISRVVSGVAFRGSERIGFGGGVNWRFDGAVWNLRMDKGIGYWMGL